MMRTEGEARVNYRSTLIVLLTLVFVCGLYTSLEWASREEYAEEDEGQYAEDQVVQEGDHPPLVAKGDAIIVHTDHTWNDLLNSQNIFPAQLDAIQFGASNESSAGNSTDGKAGATDGVLKELETILADEGLLDLLYSRYLQFFGKDDDELRSTEGKNALYKDIFKTNLIQIAKHNSEARAGTYLWESGVNQFTDMTEQELRMYTGGLTLHTDNYDDEALTKEINEAVGIQPAS